jgi:hypothetical protein
VFFTNISIGYIAGDSGTVLKTTNGGLNWIMQATETFEHLNAIFFADSATGWAAGGNGIILKTTTGGVTRLIQHSNEIPKEFKLCQNYPNPFNPKSKIKFQILKLSEAKLLIYDILGREAETLVNEQLNAGTYEVEWDASNYPGGVYYYILKAGDFTQTKKMILVK